MPKQKIGNIPHIRRLQTTLGFQTTGGERLSFVKAYKLFIKDYKTDEGTPGPSLLKWDDVKQRGEIELMAKRFLVLEDRGAKFWPDDESSPTAKPLIWAKDDQLDYNTEAQDDEESLPDISKFILSPNRRNVQSSTEGNQEDSALPRQGAMLTADSLNDAPAPIERAAPVARMMSQDTPTRPEATALVIDTERYTSSGRSCRPVQRENFVETPTFEMEVESRSSSPFSAFGNRPSPELGSRPSPELGSRISPGLGSRLSPELGADVAAASSANSPQHTRAVSEKVTDEQPRPSTEELTPPRDVNDASEAMPPPPLPRATPVATRQLRHKITYSVERTPGNYKLWDHYGTFSRMPMTEFQRILSFHDIVSVRFVIKRRGKSWEDMVAKNDDVAFQDMKVRFKDLIGGDLEEIAHTGEWNNRGDYVPYEIWIIPIYMKSDEGFSRETTIDL
ncbi:hypothetical protein F53441_7872 [Fusarium austroafricanum]|uniref:Uncharacterized protein n=1 Tax=Fusarium austroafricanum TaxID=2364996 RepID=A0A8H4KCI8_9HYPO|nr:hypothetical protein F53441_7872 [Fusarium austroafricanum]